jgi:transcriptional regulator with XRE-family HTH domain
MKSQIEKLSNKENKEIIDTISEQLLRYRNKRGMTLRKLADKSNCSAGLISAIERKKSFPSIKKLNDIGRGFNIPIEAFFNKKPIEIGEVEVDPIIFIDEFENYFKLAKIAFKNDVDINRFKKEIEYLIERKDEEEE